MRGFQVDLCPWGSTSPDSSVPSQSQSSPSAGTAKTQSHPVSAFGRDFSPQSRPLAAGLAARPSRRRHCLSLGDILYYMIALRARSYIYI